MILQASIRNGAPNGILAALVLEVDTIPKPDGLGNRIPAKTRNRGRTTSDGIQRR
jgi:hypothetical protein